MECMRDDLGVPVEAHTVAPPNTIDTGEVQRLVREYTIVLFKCMGRKENGALMKSNYRFGICAVLSLESNERQNKPDDRC